MSFELNAYRCLKSRRSNIGTLSRQSGRLGRLPRRAGASVRFEAGAPGWSLAVPITGALFRPVVVLAAELVTGVRASRVRQCPTTAVAAGCSWMKAGRGIGGGAPWAIVETGPRPIVTTTERNASCGARAIRNRPTLHRGVPIAAGDALLVVMMVSTGAATEVIALAAMGPDSI